MRLLHYPTVVNFGGRARICTETGLLSEGLLICCWNDPFEFYRVNFLRLPALLTELLPHSEVWWGRMDLHHRHGPFHGLLICCGNDSLILERVAGIEPVSFSLEGCLVTMTLPAIFGPPSWIRTSDF